MEPNTTTPQPQFQPPPQPQPVIPEPQTSFPIKIVTLLALGILILAGAVYGGMMLQKGQDKTMVADETSNWQTYRNDEYGFEVKYPSGWTAKGTWSENGGFFFVAFGIANSIDSQPLATLRVYPNQTTLDKFIKYFDYVSGTWKDTTLGGISAKEVVSTGQNSQQFILTASVKNSYGYELASTVFGNNIDTVRKMNSTFNFFIAEQPTSFNLIFKYGVDAKNELDTFTQTYTKDMVIDPPIKISLKLTDNELADIYQKMTDLQLFKESVKQVERSAVFMPCSSYYLKVQINSEQKELSWTNCQGRIIGDKFQQFTNHIIQIIESKEEYKKLPTPQGGYL